MDSPLDILAAARRNTVGPYLPAKEAWLKGWCGPVAVRVRDGASTRWVDTVWDGTGALCHGVVVAYDPGGFSDIGQWIRLDVRRPEVRDLLVRRGCPAWARDVPAAVWCWARDGYALLGEKWTFRIFKDNSRGYWRRVQGEYPPDSALADLSISVRDDWTAFGPLSERPVMGYRVTALTMRPREAGRWDDVRVFGKGAETGPEGRACADVAALRAGCILEEADGWYVPLLGGGVGWWAKDGSDAR